jgi:hypothetical protein
VDSLARQVRSNKARQGRAVTQADRQCRLEQASKQAGEAAMKRVDHESTGACSGDGRRQTAGGAAAAVQASKQVREQAASRQADS